MKKEKPSLVLNKKVVAHLNNLEMRNVRGGDGEVTDSSRVECIDEGTIKSQPVLDPAKVLLSLVLKIC